MTKKSKYDQIIDSDNFKSDFLERTEKQIISDNSDNADIEIASRNASRCIPKTQRTSNQIRQNINAISPDTGAFEACGGKMVIGDLNRFTKNIGIDYRKSKKSGKPKRRE